MKLVSWNVAGYRACLKKGFQNFFEEINVDIFCLQEVKANETEIPYQPLGYLQYLNEAEKKGYSGTLIYTKEEALSVQYGMGIDEHDKEGRMITLEFANFYLINVYVPNVKRTLERLDYRMKWEDDFLKYIKKLERVKQVIICGDFNVAHQEIDIKNYKANIGNAGFTNEERNCFTRLLENGLIDTFRYMNREMVAYSWWSYLFSARDRNIGWRIDYFLISESLLNKVKKASIYDSVLGSDHCPIGLDLYDFE